MTGTVRPFLSRRQVLGGAVAAGAATSLPWWANPTRAQSTPAADTSLPVEQIRDVVYGEAEGTTLMLDIFHPPARDAPRPAVVLLFHGGYTSGNRTAVTAPAQYFAEAGYVAFCPGFRLFVPQEDRNRWPAQLDDAQRAVRWIRANAASYGVDPERIGSYGHSAGATLAAMLGTTEARVNGDPALADYSSRVTCVVDLSGESDMTIPHPDPGMREVIADHFGGTFDEIPEFYREASPLFHVDANSAPFLVIHGARDTVASVEHARRLVAALQEAGVQVAYLELPKASHSGPGVWQLNGPWALTFFGMHLHPER